MASGITKTIRDSGRHFRDLALTQAIEICEHMEKKGRSAADCAKAIRDLLQSLPRPGDDSDDTPPGTMSNTEH